MENKKNKNSLESIYKAVSKMFENEMVCSLSDNKNTIEIVDTPAIWAVKFDDSEKIKNNSQLSVDRLFNIIKEIISQSNNYIDIVSLAPPTGEFYKVIINSLINRLLSNNNIYSIRFLFGYMPPNDTQVKDFRKSLANDLKIHLDKIKSVNPEVKIYVGRVHGDGMGGGHYIFSYWNHAKIIAADGKYALVGGHNLWPEDYRTSTPIHDISLYIKGSAARSANEYASFLWELPAKGGSLIVNRRPKWTRYRSLDFTTKNFNEKWDTTPIINPCSICPKETNDSWNNFIMPSKVKFYAQNEKKLIENVQMLGVGRFPTGDSALLTKAGAINDKDTGCLSPSEIARHHVFINSEDKLFICQQDIFFPGYEKSKDSKTAGWIVDALLSRPRLQIFIVISPAGAKSSAGTQYSFGAGPLFTYTKLLSLIKQKIKQESLEGKGILGRLHVSPFCFTNVEISTKEGIGYYWPNSKRFGHSKARFSTVMPLPRMIMVGSEFPEPGNHSKFYMSQGSNGSAFYIGSDNVYPHNLFEYGYLVDDKRACDVIYKTYWENIWKYSSTNCVCKKCDNTFFRALLDTVATYRFTGNQGSNPGGDSVFRNRSHNSIMAVNLIREYHSIKLDALQHARNTDLLHNTKDTHEWGYKEKIEAECKYIAYRLLHGKIKSEEILDNIDKKQLGYDEKIYLRDKLKFPVLQKNIFGKYAVGSDIAGVTFLTILNKKLTERGLNKF